VEAANKKTGGVPVPQLKSLSDAFLQSIEATKGKVILSQYSDINEQGVYGDRWLIVTSKFIEVYVEKSTENYTLERSLSWDEVVEVNSQNLVGSGIIEATTENDIVPLLQYSNSYAREFNYVVRALSKMHALSETERENYIYRGISDSGKKFCEKCGRLIPEWTASCPACIDKGAILKRLLAYAWPFRKQLILLTLLMLGGTALDLLPPYLGGVILIDKVLGGKPENGRQILAMVVVGLFAIQLLGTLFSVIRGRMAAWLSASLVYELRKKTYESLQKLSLSYFDKRQTGAIMSRVVHDVNGLNNFLIEGVQYFLVQVLLLIGIGAILFSINPKLAFWVIIPAPVVVFLSFHFWKYIWKLFASFWHRNSKMTAVLNDSLSGVRVIKAFAQEDRELDRFDQRSRDLYNASVQAEQSWATLFPWLSFVLTLGSLFVYFIGGSDVLLGTATVGQLVTFMNYIGRFYGPLQFLSRITDWLTRSLTSAERVFEILDAQPDVVDAPEPIRLPHIKGDVRFENVTFGYDEHDPVLQNVSFTVKAGEMLGVVGHSGAGKSTIINLLCRFYDPNEGRITIDGVDLREIAQQDIRSQVGMVLQETFLFNGTIAENIAYAKPKATMEEIVRAAKVANAHDYITSFPNGYDTFVGERGARLSGGERQRIAIARAILHDPRILILDEATSAVDTETEQKIQEAIDRLVQNRTTVAIAHRLSTLRNADKLIIIEDGKIVEAGSPDELLAKKGHYYNLVMAQEIKSKAEEEKQHEQPA